MRLLRVYGADFVGNPKFVYRDFHGASPDPFLTDRDQTPLLIFQVLGDVTGNRARHIVRFCSLLHPRCDVDRSSVDPDRALRVALLADDDLAAVAPDPKERTH